MIILATRKHNRTLLTKIIYQSLTVVVCFALTISNNCFQMSTVCFSYATIQQTESAKVGLAWEHGVRCPKITINGMAWVMAIKPEQALIVSETLYVVSVQMIM